MQLSTPKLVCISTSNLAAAYIRIFTVTLISHNAQNHPMDVLTVAFFVQDYITLVS